jgi:hypothetical protein
VGTIRILDITDADSFGRIPPCADPGFDHRSCDYWEDAARGSKAARLSWLEPAGPAGSGSGHRDRAPRTRSSPIWRPRPTANPFATARPATRS